MGFESEGAGKEEFRKNRRQKEKGMVALALGGIVAIVVLLVVVICVAVKVISGGANHNETAANASQEESVVDAVTSNEEAPVEEDTVETTQTEETLSSEKDCEETAEDTEESTAAEETAETQESDESETSTKEEDSSQENVAEIEKQIDEKIAQMTIEQKVAQLFIVTPEQLLGYETPITSVGSAVNEKLNTYPVGGFIFTTKNMESEDGFSQMIFNLSSMSSEKKIYAVAEDGGEDSPFVESQITENILASETEIRDSLGEAGAYSNGISIGSELKQYGVNLNIGPYADLSLQNGSYAQKHGFGSDIDEVTKLAQNVVSGLKDQGVATAVKYFPGYGDVNQNGSSGVVSSKRTIEDLLKEGEIYKNAIETGAKAVVISHVGLPKVRGDNRPACLSKEVVTDIVREEWQFDGVVMTDMMNKPCIYQKYTYAEAAEGAIEAGCDLIVGVKNFEKSYNGLLDAVKKGRISEERINESLRRIYRLKNDL